MTEKTQLVFRYNAATITKSATIEFPTTMQLNRRHLSNQKRSARSEKSAAELIGGRRQPASGAVKALGLKGDVKSEKYLLEDKVTRQKSYAIASAYWQKHANYAWRTGKRPLLRISFDSGPVLVCMDEQTFRELNENSCTAKEA